MNKYVYMCVCVCIYELPRWLGGKESTCQGRRCGFDDGSDLLKEGKATHSSILVWRIT